MPKTAEQQSELAAVATMASASIAPPQAGVMFARMEQPFTSTAGGVAAPSLPMSAPADAEALRGDERQRSTLHNILLELHSAFPGIENAIIATLDGRVLSALYPAQGTSLAAMTSAMYPLATHTDRLLDGGGLKQLLFRYATVTLVVYPIAEVATLSILSAAHGNSGMLRSTCREAIGRIVEVLKR
jgi:predicted regulator of Ras-like GTPase activity (Roadblock/LC7/MglB family)